MTLLSHIRAGLMSLMLVAALAVSPAVNAASMHACCDEMAMATAAAAPCADHGAMDGQTSKPGKAAQKACALHCASLSVTAALPLTADSALREPAPDTLPITQLADSVSAVPGDHTPPPPRFA